MIFDTLDHYKVYQRSLPELWDMVRFLNKMEKGKLPEGEYRLNKGLAMITSGQTRCASEKLFESHKKFLDIQVMCEGEEEWELSDIDNVRMVSAYDAQKDMATYSGSGEHIRLLAGHFIVVYPWEAHKPSVHFGDTPFSFRKVIVKVPTDPITYSIWEGDGIKRWS